MKTKGRRAFRDLIEARYNIRKFTTCGESGEVKETTVDSWKERLPKLVEVKGCVQCE